MTAPFSIEMSSAWKSKAAALDRYRWRLLREHYGLLGALLRFMKEAVADLWFGYRARRCVSTKVNAAPCDVLMLQSAEKVISFQRKKTFLARLAQRYQLTEAALESRSMILHERHLVDPGVAVPLRYFGYAAYAEWIVSCYQPRLLLNDRNGSLYTPFLRLSLRRRNALLVHLAHATTVEHSRRLGMNDYDYYLLFGQSSYEALKRRQLIFGDSTVLLAGSHMVDEAYNMPPTHWTNRTLLILGVGPDKEKERGYQATYDLLASWAECHPEYHVQVKRHPRSKAKYWSETSRKISNVVLLPEACTLAEALRGASIVINIMSNAVIEAGLARRPLIHVNLSADEDIFEQIRLGAEVRTKQELDDRIEQIERDYDSQVNLAEHFAEYHLAHGVKGLETTLEILDELFRNARAPAGMVAYPLKGTV
ncbi:hypothetical protein IQ22_02067 [Pseudomonas duriflava]|uniref:Capsule biosynthesis protein n=1 Tax=Pseudomonas duriflava TaxID=459528 RepID=A0A562QBR6_9PSED|nr:capsule biosynthesis protein [Pseudomonas duriflava]TWI54205.1 hypothetical protein IQ22_02067 [Pseudomonas duriflava]